jgi:uncharacterized RDD family membrane protein YckC
VPHPPPAAGCFQATVESCLAGKKSPEKIAPPLPIVPSAAAPLDTLRAVEAPEGIALTLRPAGIAPRCLAYLIDLCIRAVLFVLILVVAGRLGGLGAAVVFISLFALEWLYPVAFELMPRGATPGKRALGLCVVMDSGLPITPAAALLRNLLRGADFMPGAYAAGAAALLLRPDFKRLGDMAAGTLVVYADSARLDGPLPDAAPTPPARPLTARQQLAIVTWAGRASRLTPERLGELALLAAGVCAPPPPAGADAARARLLGVARWLSGQREDAPRETAP